MSQRLTIELANDGEVLASCYYHEAATTDSALDLTETIIRAYNDIFGGRGADVFTAVKLFEAIGGGINGFERNRIIHDSTGRFKGIDFASSKSAFDGIISVTSEGIREARRWENGRVKIDLTKRQFDFHVHCYTYMEEYIEFSDRVPGCVPWEDLPQIDAGADLFTGIYFDHIGMIRRIVAQCPDGFKLRYGDVIEWI